MGFPLTNLNCWIPPDFWTINSVINVNQKKTSKSQKVYGFFFLHPGSLFLTPKKTTYLNSHHKTIFAQKSMSLPRQKKSGDRPAAKKHDKKPETILPQNRGAKVYPLCCKTSRSLASRFVGWSWTGWTEGWGRFIQSPWWGYSKKSPTGPGEWTPKPEYLIALAPYLGVHW